MKENTVSLHTLFETIRFPVRKVVCMFWQIKALFNECIAGKHVLVQMTGADTMLPPIQQLATPCPGKTYQMEECNQGDKRKRTGQHMRH